MPVIAKINRGLERFKSFADLQSLDLTSYVQWYHSTPNAIENPINNSVNFIEVGALPYSRSLALLFEKIICGSILR
ncbi:MAG: hypothetical protein ACK5QX_04265, partial [bacterium]